MSLVSYQRITVYGVGFKRGYGGCNPPCRQRFSAKLRINSRAVPCGCLPKVIARPVDGFFGSGFDFGFDLAFKLFSQLRFLIISEVSATGYLLNTIKKQPNSLMAIGFDGVLSCN